MKVIDEKPVPTEQITCSNCKSILEYGNADLYKDYRFWLGYLCGSDKYSHYDSNEH